MVGQGPLRSSERPFAAGQGGVTGDHAEVFEVPENASDCENAETSLPNAAIGL